MTMTHSLVTLNGGQMTLTLRLGKYDTNPFSHDLNMQSKRNYKTIIEVWEWKSYVQMEIERCFLSAI
jgi:hypothetical protein